MTYGGTVWGKGFRYIHFRAYTLGKGMGLSVLLAIWVHRTDRVATGLGERPT